MNQLTADHVDISSPAFGIQEQDHFPDIVRRHSAGHPGHLGGYMYWSGKPGLGIEVDEKIAAKHPLKPIPDGATWPLEHAPDGAVVKP